MSISVREIIALKEFKAFKLIAGESGLDNQVSSIGILDYMHCRMVTNPENGHFGSVILS